MSGRAWQAGLLALLLGPLLAACAPRIAPLGPGPGPAALETIPGEETETFVTADGYRLTLRAWLPETPAQAAPRAVVLALHGFNDHATFIAPAAELWAAESDIATFAYDQRGFGASPNRGIWAGAETYAEDARTALTLLRGRYPETPLFLLGESMGGAIAIVALAGEVETGAVEEGATRPPLDGVILAAPGVWARETMPFLQRASLFLVSHTLPWLALKPSGVRIQASDNIEALRALGKDPLTIKRTRMDAIHGLVDVMDQALASAQDLDVPALLLYGEKDELIPPTAMIELWRRLPRDTTDQRRALYPEGWHLLFKDLQAKTVIRDVAAWIEDPDAPLPSGADAQAETRLAAEQ
ncbi:MAG: alpha/beta hydrolase [Rhodospirillales bacterium]